jgi:fucose permease
MALDHSLTKKSATVGIIPLVVAFAAFIFIGSNDGAGGVLLPSYETVYNLNKSTVSTLFFPGTCGYLLAAFTSGMLTEWLGRRLLLTMGALVMLVGMGIIASVPPWFMVLGAFLLIGFGIATIDAGLNAFVAGLPNNTALLNYLHAFYGVGALLGPLLASSLLATGWAWNTVFIVLATLAGVLALACATAFGRTAPPAEHDAAAKDANVMRATLTLPVVWTSALLLLLYVGAEVTVGSWSYSLLTQQRGISVLWAGRMVSGFWLGLTLGRLVLGSATRRLGNSAMISLCLGGVTLSLLLLLIPSAWGNALALVLAGFSFGPVFPTMIALISQNVPARLLPSAVGFLASFGSAGAALFPWVAGKLANQFGIGSMPVYAAGLTIVMLGLWFAVRRLVTTGAGRSAGAAAD